MSLKNVYESIKFDNPNLAQLLSKDFQSVAMHAVVADHTLGQAAADRLRQNALYLPEIQKRVLNNSLTDLGYS